MDSWPTYADFSPAFLEEHRDLVLWHTYHHAKAYLLYPCGCKERCACPKSRQKILLSLNGDFYNKAVEASSDETSLRAIKLIFNLPDEAFWQKQYPDAYPLWLMDQTFVEREVAFKAVGRLVWTLLRLGQSYEKLFRQPRASITEALEVILGQQPLKATQKKDYLGGEKAYGKYFSTYRKVCYLVAACEYLREDFFAVPISSVRF